MLYHVHCNDWPSKHVFYALNLRIFGNYGWRARSPAFLKIGCRALAFHIFKNLRLFDKKIVAGLKFASSAIETCRYVQCTHDWATMRLIASVLAGPDPGFMFTYLFT